MSRRAKLNLSPNQGAAQSKPAPDLGADRVDGEEELLDDTSRAEAPTGVASSAPLIKIMVGVAIGALCLYLITRKR